MLHQGGLLFQLFLFLLLWVNSVLTFSLAPYRYRIKLTVDDGTSSTTFVLFESDARALLKKSCAEMIGSNNMVEYFDAIIF